MARDLSIGAVVSFTPQRVRRRAKHEPKTPKKAMADKFGDEREQRLGVEVLGRGDLMGPEVRKALMQIIGVKAAILSADVAGNTVN